MNNSIVEVEDLTKIYEPSPLWMKFLVRSNLTESVTALDRVNFKVRPGETLAIVGPNGAGKSTAFRVLVGLTAPTTGSARIFGMDCTKQSHSVRRMVGWMPAEDRSLLMRQSCAENLRFHGRLHGMEKPEIQERTEIVLDDVGLSRYAKASPFALSAGMRARLQLARALFHQPRVLILDEPTGSVDPVAAHSLLELITGIVKAKNLAALISSHRLEEIEALHSHVILLDRGQVRYDGELDSLRNQYDRRRIELEFTSTNVASDAHATMQKLMSVELAEVTGKALTLTMRPGSSFSDVLAHLNHTSDELVRMRDQRTPLRDVLAAVYRDR